MNLINVLEHAFMISGFVFIMMLVIEYIHVQTRGAWQEKLGQNKWGQYLLAAFLGAVPGCLGPFTVVALYSHNIVSFGALVGSMIATSGDEAYVMLSLFHEKAVLIFGILLGLGILAGYLSDLLLRKTSLVQKTFSQQFTLHEEEYCECFIKDEIIPQLRHLSMERGLLMGILLIFTAGLIVGEIGPTQWNWIRITLLLSGGFGLFVAVTVPNHFLKEHLWKHVMKKHLPRIFLWTFGALLVIHILENYLDLNSWVQSNYLTVLIVAVLIGIIPESGPHLFFVTLFAKGTLPFSILLASSIVQDGHGMLPLLAVSKKSFVGVKIINFLIGFGIGITGLWLF